MVRSEHKMGAGLHSRLIPFIELLNAKEFFVVIALLYISILVAKKRKEKDTNNHACLRELRRRQTHARRRRREWLAEHPEISVPFLYPDYHQLWVKELDAESALNKCCSSETWESWHEYQQEKQSCETS